MANSRVLDYYVINNNNQQLESSSKFQIVWVATFLLVLTPTSSISCHSWPLHSLDSGLDRVRYDIAKYLRQHRLTRSSSTTTKSTSIRNQGQVGERIECRDKMIISLAFWSKTSMNTTTTARQRQWQQKR